MEGGKTGKLLDSLFEGGRRGEGWHEDWVGGVIEGIFGVGAARRTPGGREGIAAEF